MKNKKTLFVILIIFLVVSLFFCWLFVYSQSFNYDNKLSIINATDKRYSKQEIDKLEEEISFSNIYTDYSFWEFNLKYKPECVRKTPFGYYAVLLHEDHSLCFVFWTFENKIYSIYRTNGFVSSNEFRNSIVIGESTFEEMKGSGFDYFCYPLSKKMATAHICTDGILVVEYDDNRVAKSVDFYSNEELIKTNDAFLRVVPYILPKDKQSGDDNQGTVL